MLSVSTQPPHVNNRTKWPARVSLAAALPGQDVNGRASRK